MLKTRFQFAATALSVTLIVPCMAQSTVQQNMRWEAAFTCAKTYANPFMDVTLRVEFTKPGSQPINAYGFWDGGKTFRIRNAFPEPGVWKYQTISSDRADAGLHNRTGSIEVLPYTGDNPLYRHGFLRVSKNRRYLEHADETPFLWMGETLWGATVWLTEDGWKEAIDTLRSKRFTVLQTNFARHDEVDRSGHSPWNGDRWNVEFMQKLDRMFNYANDHGTYLFINGFIDLKLDRGITGDSFERMLQMIAARYSAHYVGYSSSMDDEYSIQQDQANSFLDAVTKRHLLTQHAGSTDPYPPKGNMWTALQYYDKRYLDFVMVETGWRGQWFFSPGEPSIISLYNHEPHKPIINGEAAYEGLYDATAEDCARYAWATFLSGGCGFTHGGHLWDARDANLAAWQNLPGKSYMTIVHDFLISVNDGRCLTPRHELVLNQPDRWEDRMPVAVTDEFSHVVAHLPKGGTIRLNLSELPATASIQWFDPLKGNYTKGGTVDPGSNRSFTSPAGSQQMVLLIIARPKHSRERVDSDSGRADTNQATDQSP